MRFFSQLTHETKKTVEVLGREYSCQDLSREMVGLYGFCRRACWLPGNRRGLVVAWSRM